MKEELNGIKEDIKDVLLLGLGALSLTGEKAVELKPVFRFFSTRKFRLKKITNEKTREKYMKIADYRRFFLFFTIDKIFFM